MKWVKLASGMLRDEKVHFIIKRHGHDSLTFWIGMLTESKNGLLEMDEEVFADLLMIEAKRYAEIRSIFIRHGLVTESNGEKLKVTNWEKYQYSESYARVKKHRESTVTQSNESETPKKQDCNAVVTVDTDTDTEKKKTKAHTPFVLPPEIPAELWRDYEDHRKKLRKPMTDLAKKLAAEKALKVAREEQEPVEAVIKRAIEMGWQMFFPDRNREKTKAGDSWREGML